MGLADSKYKDSFITQDELDSLLDDARSTPLSLEASDDPGREDDDPIITQEDIDALLNLGRSAMEDPAPDSEAPKDEDLVSQEDIDALLASHKPTKKRKRPEPAPEPGLDDGLADLDLVTPEDIRKLLQSEASTGPEDNPESITDEDIKALISGTDLAAPSAPEDVEDDTELITQDDIDALLAGVTKEAPRKRGKSEGIPEPMADMGTVDNVINPADIDNLLNSTGESREPAGARTEDPGDDSNLISQDDIDKLLMGKYQEPEEEEETTLIDQEDIDRLLSSARPFGDESPAKSQEPDKLISQADIDRLLQEDDREKEKTDDDLHDQVILEKSEEREEKKIAPPKKPKEKKEKKPFPKKKLLVGLAAAFVLAVAGAGSFYVYKLKTGGAEDTGQETAVSDHAPVTGHEETAGHSVQGETAAEVLETVTVTMNDFVALAPPGAKGSSYIALSLTFQIAETPENPVKEYEPFFRNIVYEVMNKALASQGGTVVAEADLKAMIMDALNGALTQGTVSVLEFIDFETG